MRILVINWQDWTNPYAGGAEVYIREIFSRLADKHEITLLCSGFKGSKREEILDNINIVRRANRLDFNFWVYRNLASFVRHYKFDVVIDDLNKIPFYSPHILKGSVKTLALMMHLFKEAIFKETNPLFASYVYISERLIGALYKHTLFGVLSPVGKLELSKIGIPPENIYIIPPGVDEEKFRPVEKTNKKYLLYTGRLKRYKSVDHILHALAILNKRDRRYELEIVGRGDDETRLKEIVKALKLEKQVHFAGFVDEDSLVKKYQQASILIQPSLKEGWGLSVTEAGACKVPVIASDVPGLSDSVVNNKTGFLYAYGDINTMAERIELLMEDKALRERMGEENFKWSMNFTWDRARDKMENLVKRVQE